MKKNKTTINLVAKLIGGTMFLGVFLFNLASFVKTDASGISFSALKAYAQSGGTGNEEEEVSTGVASVTQTSTLETETWVADKKTCTKSRTIAKVTCNGTGTIACTPSTDTGAWSATVCK